MNTSTRSMGHAEGTCAPFRWKRGGPSPESGIGVPLMSCPFVPFEVRRRLLEPRDLAVFPLQPARGARRGMTARSGP